LFCWKIRELLQKGLVEGNLESYAAGNVINYYDVLNIHVKKKTLLIELKGNHQKTRNVKIPLKLLANPHEIANTIINTCNTLQQQQN